MIFYLVLTLVLVGGLSYLIYLQQADAELKKWFLPALILKFTCGILVGFLYQYYYGGGDTFVYQAQSKLLYEYFKTSPTAYFRFWFTGYYESETLRTSIHFLWYSNSYSFIIWLSLLNIFTGGSYYLNALYLSLFCFFGTWQLVRTLVLIYPEKKLAAIIAFLFLPSVVFWSAGITKEAIYLGSICWLGAIVLRLAHKIEKITLWQLISLCWSAYLLWKIKFYFAAVVYPLLFSYALLTWAAKRFNLSFSLKKQLIFLTSLLLVFSVIVAQLSPVFKLDFFYEQLMYNYQNLLKLSVGKPVLYLPNLKPNFISVVMHLPVAAWQGTVRPFIWEGSNLLCKIAATENLQTLLLLFLYFINLLLHKLKGVSLAGLLLLIYILVIAGLIGLTTPNLGSLSRYKITYLPFLVYLLLQNPLVYKFISKERFRFIRNKF